MDFAEVVSRAKEWSSRSSSDFQVSSVLEGEGRINFKSQRRQKHSFFITLPSSDQEEWVCGHHKLIGLLICSPFFQGVWSEEEDCIGVLSLAMEQVSRPTHTLEEVLEKVVELLKPNKEQEVEEEEEEKVDDDEEEEEEEEEEEDFEDYYDHEDFDAGAADKWFVGTLSLSLLIHGLLLIPPFSSSEEEESATNFFIGQGSPAAVHRLLAGYDVFPGMSSCCLTCLYLNSYG